jgi:hypothetical protein
MSSAFKKYTPPSLRGAADQESTATSSRWTYTSRDSNGEEQQLRNTSAASRFAPELAPSIIAPKRSDDALPASRSLLSRPVKVSLSSEEEFPTMGKKPAVAAAGNAWAAKPSFASLSREWAEKQQKDKEEEKLQAERNAILERERRLQKEKEDKERLAHQHLNYTRSESGRESDDDSKYDIGGSTVVYDGDDDSPVSDTYDEDDGEEEEVDDTWEHNRNKHDYY